jgi:hypothetical protein
MTRAPQQGFHAGSHLERFNGLGDKVVRTGLKRPQPGREISPPAIKKDRHFGSAGVAAELSASLDPIYAGEVHIQKNDVRLLVGQPHSGLAVRDRHHFNRPTQFRGEEDARLVIVLR